MSKKEKTSEIKKPEATEAKEAPKGAPAHGGGGHSAPSPSGRGSTSAKVGCHAVGCKEKDHRFNFCDEHFRQFKFGLISKSGDRVLDYERKLEHYQNWLKAQKVA